MILAFAAFGAEPVHGYVDLHLHLAAHLTVPVYGRGPDAREPAHPTADHALRPQLFAAELAKADATIYVSLAYANPFATAFETHDSMWARMERQLAFVAAFCAEHPDRYALARTPSEARTAIAAGRTVFVNGIEGAARLIRDRDDVRRLADRGVAVVTPVHLADDELGGAMCMDGSMRLLNLPGCRRERRDPEHHGLTPAGVAAVGWMADAGIVIDLAHASPRSLADMMGILAARHVAPVYTHVKARALRDTASAVSDADLRAIEALGGLVGVTANVHDIAPIPPVADPARCTGSIDDLRAHWDHVVAVTDGQPVAWGSDFQGGVAHIRPKYGPDGCFPARADGAPLDAFDVEGLSSVGRMPDLWRHMAADGADLRPLDASAERFLRIWEVARGERASVAD